MGPAPTDVAATHADLETIRPLLLRSAPRAGRASRPQPRPPRHPGRRRVDRGRGTGHDGESGPGAPHQKIG
jgi:hypothetical protein